MIARDRIGILRDHALQIFGVAGWHTSIVDLADEL